MADKSSCEFYFSEDVPLKTSFYVCFIRPKQSNPKGWSSSPSPVGTCCYAFLYLESTALTAPLKFNYLTVPPPFAEGGGGTESGNWCHLCAPFSENTMTTLATDLLQ
jgi:hypothetical protein